MLFIITHNNTRAHQIGNTFPYVDVERARRILGTNDGVTPSGAGWLWLVMSTCASERRTWTIWHRNQELTHILNRLFCSDLPPLYLSLNKTIAWRQHSASTHGGSRSFCTLLTHGCIRNWWPNALHRMWIFTTVTLDTAACVQRCAVAEEVTWHQHNF